MRSAITFVCLLSCLSLVAVQPGLAQTRARRVEQKIPDSQPSSSPSPQTSNSPEQRKDEPPAPVEKVDPAELDVIRVDTNLVTVPVSVLDRNGRYIPDLQKEDFQVHEDGVEQELAYFATAEKSVTVILMIDTSTSTWSKLGQIKDAARAFVEQLRPDDRVMVTSFARGLTIKCEPTTDRETIRKAINGTGKGSSTHLYDSMDKLMQKHLDRIEGRKAVVLFTDGVDATSDDSTYESTVERAQELDALIYSIRYDTYDPDNDTGGSSTSSRVRLPSIFGIPLPFPTIGSGSSGGGAGSTKAEYDRGQRYLHDLSHSTGGRVFEAGRSLNYLRDAFSQIAEELSRQYTLGYYPRKKDGFGERRRISVRVQRSDVAIRARQSYVYKEPSVATTSRPKK